MIDTTKTSSLSLGAVSSCAQLVERSRSKSRLRLWLRRESREAIEKAKSLEDCCFHSVPSCIFHHLKMEQDKEKDKEKNEEVTASQMSVGMKRKNPPHDEGSASSAAANAQTMMVTTKKQQPPLSSLSSESCPYLDTINRSLLDFDFEPSCCVTLESSPHVYGCLVCGKFFRGKGKQTPAYLHSVNDNHSVFVHLQRGTFHCLPEDYVIRDPSLRDISDALHPTFTRDDVRRLDSNRGLARDLFGRRYLPGFVGLNNLNKTDYINATVQALAHVRPLRDFFLRLGGDERGRGLDGNHANTGTKYSTLVQCLGELMRKMWSEKRFKSTVDPHMFVQAVSVESKKRYTIGKQVEVGEFIAWLLHRLHIGLGGTHRAKSSIVHDVFMGTVEVTTRQRKRKKKHLKVEEGGELYEEEEDDRVGSDDEEEYKAKEEEEKTREEEKQQQINDDNTKWTVEETTTTTNFLQLTLDIPEKPLFKDEEGGLVIPQEPLVSVLRKFDGVSFNDVLDKRTGGVLPVMKRRYRIQTLPKYLILHLARFKRNGFYIEKNPTIVPFPVKNLDLSHYVFHSDDTKKKKKKKEKRIPTKEEVQNMSVKQLKALLTKHGRADIAENHIDKAELVEATLDFVTKSLPDLLADKYDLVANITHNNPAEVGREGRRDPLEEGSYRCHVQHEPSGQWYEIQDLHVQETMPQLIGLSECYVLIFERKGLR